MVALSRREGTRPGPPFPRPNWRKSATLAARYVASGRLPATSAGLICASHKKFLTPFFFSLQLELLRRTIGFAEQAEAPATPKRLGLADEKQ
ncbi:hypothetical protein [Cupriavidus basilensis]|uniref:hypothetical protein n=1 Tax=Cupriavidus basilensis TaxID=68895 RepID=UPI0023E8DB8D|nr:hypothetical protein [Cupriavidus basilensis]MDF3889372.1 hypothetical protein [Cupriavidus basilensis]